MVLCIIGLVLTFLNPILKKITFLGLEIEVSKALNLSYLVLALILYYLISFVVRWQFDSVQERVERVKMKSELALKSELPLVKALAKEIEALSAEIPKLERSHVDKKAEFAGLEHQRQSKAAGPTITKIEDRMANVGNEGRSLLQQIHSKKNRLQGFESLLTEQTNALTRRNIVLWLKVAMDQYAPILLSLFAIWTLVIGLFRD